MASLLKAPVDDAGSVLAYIDSGPPSAEVYTTVVLVHGHSFNSQTFVRLLPLASSYTLRIIALNRRDYTGSTPLSDADLALLFSSNAEDHRSFLLARGLEIARFLAWMIDELKIPPANRQSGKRLKGGLVLLGWSLGSITTLAFLRNLPRFPRDLVEKIDPYLKTFIMYDSGYATLGYSHPAGAYHPIRDASISVSERQAMFNTWISTYYVHAYYASPGVEGSRTLESLALRSPILAPDSNTSEDEEEDLYMPPSVANIDPQAFSAAIESFPERSEIAFHKVMKLETLHDLLDGSLFSASPYSEASALEGMVFSMPLPDLQVIYMFGTHSPWTTQYCSWSLEADIKSHLENFTRPVNLIRVDGGNHFLHWDYPDKFLAILAEIGGVVSDSQASELQ